MFLQLHKPPVLIDEVQYAPELFTYIKIYADQHKEPGVVWMTGSQIFKLMRGVQESLAGRVAVLNMTTLSQAEISGADMEPFTVDLNELKKRALHRNAADVHEIFNRIYAGSMPAVVSGTNSDKRIFYSSYISTYLERDAFVCLLGYRLYDLRSCLSVSCDSLGASSHTDCHVDLFRYCQCGYRRRRTGGRMGLRAARY